MPDVDLPPPLDNDDKIPLPAWAYWLLGSGAALAAQLLATPTWLVLRLGLGTIIGGMAAAMFRTRRTAVVVARARREGEQAGAEFMLDANRRQQRDRARARAAERRKG